MNKTRKVIITSCISLCSVNVSYAKVTYLHANPMGSMIAATDESGVQVWIKRYTPFGIESRLGEVQDSGSNQGFSTHELDTETSLLYMKARYYDPLIGRFYSRDLFEDGYNYYIYSSNNPINYYDPSGNVKDWGALFTQSLGLIGGGIGAIGGLTLMGSGIIGAAAPEPLTSIGGVALFGAGFTAFSYGADGMSENISAIMNNVMETDYARKSTLKSDMALLTGNDINEPKFNAVFDSVGLATGLVKDPLKLMKMPSYLETAADMDTAYQTSGSIYNSYDSISGSLGWSYSNSWNFGGSYNSSNYGSNSSSYNYDYSF